MTDTPDDATQPADVDEALGQPDDDETATRASQQAAEYRTKLRDAEAERDTLQGRLTNMLRAEAERVAGASGLQDGADVWLTGTDVADLLDDDGNVDPGKVKETVQRITADRPGLLASTPGFDGGVRRAARSETSWAGVLRGRSGQ